jgi:hypothetical protein
VRAVRTALALLPDLEAFVAPEASPYGWTLFAPPNSTMVPPWLFDLLAQGAGCAASASCPSRYHLSRFSRSAARSASPVRSVPHAS